jgi:DUF2971 family protein
MLSTMEKSSFVYKFLESPHFLDEGLFRFSQPGALNDPVESLPDLVIDQFSEEDIANARSNNENSDLEFLSDEQFANFVLRPFPGARLDDKSFPGLWPVNEPRLKNDPIRTIQEYDKLLAAKVVESCNLFANENIGIFSLTDRPSDPMWAHYAKNHSGLMVYFDRCHKFFRSELRSVQYTDRKISVSMNEGIIRLGGNQLRVEDILNENIGLVPVDLFYQKQLDWAHEHEIRMIDQLSNANKFLEESPPGYPIYLFEVPHDAVLAIEFGYKASGKSIDSAVSKIKSSHLWRHVVVYTRTMSSRGVARIKIHESN